MINRVNTCQSTFRVITATIVIRTHSSTLSTADRIGSRFIEIPDLLDKFINGRFRPVLLVQRSTLLGKNTSVGIGNLNARLFHDPESFLRRLFPNLLLQLLRFPCRLAEDVPFFFRKGVPYDGADDDDIGHGGVFVQSIKLAHFVMPGKMETGGIVLRTIDDPLLK